MGLMIFYRAMKMAFKRMRTSRSWRFMPQITGAAFLASAVSAAVAFPAGPAAAQAHPSYPRAFSQTIAVTSLADTGAGSLRDAITSVNASAPGTSTLISFDVPGTITLASRLPAIIREVTIDATTAPTYVSGGAPVVAIDCNGQPGVEFSAGSDGSQLLGVAVDDSSSNGVTLDAGSVTLNDDYIGLNLAGAAAGNGGDGVYVSSASAGNFIGLNASGVSGAVANVISGNLGSGIELIGSASNTIVANRIGTNPAGTLAIPNHGNGIAITGGSLGNEIGGTSFTNAANGQANNPTGTAGTVSPVLVVPPLGNLLSGNLQSGVLIETGSHGNTLNGNFIGTTASGDGPLGNAGDGVWINKSPDNSLVGCGPANNPFAYYNVVSGNGLNGLRVTSSNGVTAQGNFFGIGADNAAIVKNGLDGILVDGSSAGTQVGGATPLGNVSAGNGTNGIEVTGTASGFVTSDTFGGLFAYKTEAPNGGDGLLINSTGGNNLVQASVFSGNVKNGIELAGDASGVTVLPGIVGLDAKGATALPNGENGLLIDDSAHQNVIGGTLSSGITQNTFSGNTGYGVAITGWAWGNHVTLSFIGTNILGASALANKRGGVRIADNAALNTIGGPQTSPSNLISGNTGDGVTLDSGTFDNAVIRNYIGLNKSGGALPNSGTAIVNHGYFNVIEDNKSTPV